MAEVSRLKKCFALLAGGLMLVLLSVAMLAITFFYVELQGFFALWMFALIVGCMLLIVGKKALDKNLKEKAQTAETQTI